MNDRNPLTFSTQLSAARFSSREPTREVINQLRVSRSDTQSSQNKGTSGSTGSTGSSQTSKTARPAERGEG